MIPIIFLHRGYNIYMEYTLRQCRNSNPKADIFLLGDENNNRFSFLKHFSLSSLPVSYGEFDALYEHLSINSKDYELFCFHRWFILRDFMILQQLSSIFVCDTDLMVYKDVADYDAWTKRENKYAAFCITNQSESTMHWCASAHSSYWTLEGITAFCDFLVYMYQSRLSVLASKWQYHTDNDIPGGICDMTLLYLFYSSNRSRIINLLVVRDNEVFDNNINEGTNLSENEYQTNEKGLKRVRFTNRKAEVFNNGLKTFVQFNSLHFQGSGKQKVHLYYRGNATAQLFLKWLNDKTSRRYNRYKGQLTGLLAAR